MARKGLQTILPSSVWVQMQQRQTGDQEQQHSESIIVLFFLNTKILPLRYVFTKNIFSVDRLLSATVTSA